MHKRPAVSLYDYEKVDGRTGAWKYWGVPGFHLILPLGSGLLV
jgi:hypothetical protein